MHPFFIFIAVATSNLVSGYTVTLSGDGDVIRAGTAQFTAEVFDENGQLSDSRFTFIWTDDSVPPHTGKIETTAPAYWNITYDKDTKPGTYNVKVEVKKKTIFLVALVGTATTSFNVTEYLEGDILLTQGNYTRGKYISNDMSVNHTVVLKKSHLDYVKSTKYLMRVFWFVDCVYYGPRSGFDFVFNYTKKTDSVHFVEALVVYFPIVQTANNTTSLNSSILNGTLSKEDVNVTTVSPLAKNSSASQKIDDTDNIDKALRDWLVNFNTSKGNSTLQHDGYCINSSVIPINSKYVYGFFRRNVTVKAPVKISPINGTNWLMDGEILNINVSCNGSSPYSFCVLLKSGLYNITGNETCPDGTIIRNCTFGIQHLFKRPSEYTLVVIIANSVSRVVKPIAVNIYKVKKHAQLSVIIVPVAFSLIATILIIFGVAYYVQSKHRYTIEVADFDFGNQTNNMEYKSFRDRLRESISNSFLKSNDFLDDDSSWSEPPPTSRKYGSMQ